MRYEHVDGVDVTAQFWNGFKDCQEFVLESLDEMTGKPLFKTRMHPSRGRYDGLIQPCSQL